MKNVVFLVLILSLVSQIEGKPIEPDSLNLRITPLSYGFETDINNKYLWRGISYNEGFVVQSNAWISYRNFTIGVWSSLIPHDLNNSIKRNEIDIFLSYDFTFSKLNIENSLTRYTYPYQEDSPPTAEYYLGLSYPLGDFSINSNFTIDILEYSGAYFVEHGIAYDYQLSEKIYLSSSLSIGWASTKFNETYVGISKPALSIFSTNLSLSYQPVGNLFVKPHIQLNRIIDKDLYELLDKYSVYFGVLFSSEF